MAPLLGAELVVAGVGGAGAYFVLSRRKYAWKLEKALGLKEEAELDLPPGVTQEYNLPDIDRVAFKEAFLHNVDFKWLAAHPGIEDNAHPNSKVMLDMTWFVIEGYLRMVERFGFLLVKRDDKGKFQGAIGLLPPYARWWHYQTHDKVVAMSLSRMGRKSTVDKLGCHKRFKAYKNALNEHQKEVVLNDERGSGHWSIPIIGVASGSQGHGTGRLLAETVTRLCPRPIYVACSEHRETFFQKVGFVVDKRFPMCSEGGNQKLEDIIYYNSMTCK